MICIHPIDYGGFKKSEEKIKFCCLSSTFLHKQGAALNVFCSLMLHICGNLHKEQHSWGQRWLSMRNVPGRLINDVTFPRQPHQKQKWVVGFIKALPLNCCWVFVFVLWCFFTCFSHIEGLKANAWVNHFVSGLFWLRRSPPPPAEPTTKMPTVQILNKMRCSSASWMWRTGSSVWSPLSYSSVNYS